jgi:serine/threonine protein phosphatase 1
VAGPGKKVRVPEGQRLYAVGDIHGHLELLERLHAMILADAQSAGGADNYVVYLGDYVDRGPDSRGVIEALCERPLPGFETVHLKGNHEDFMLRFLDGSEAGPNWFQNGGDTTLASYDVARPMEWSGADAYDETRAALAAALSAGHRTFLDELSLSYEAGDFFFAHAGVRPEVPLAEQRPQDLMWIRGAFLDATQDFGKVVVHGHTPESKVQVRANRIGIDTGAFYTGCLTCLVLEGNKRRFLQT